MQSTQNQSPLKTYFPLVHAECKNKESSNERISTLESFAKEYFSSHSQFMLGFKFKAPTADEEAQNAFTELTHQVDAYNNKNKTKQYLSGMIAAACVVGIVANTVLGFTALGVALITTLNYFPYDQQLNAEKMKATLNACEALLDKHHGSDLKNLFQKMNPRFADVPETFYSNINKINFTYLYTEDDDSLKRLEFLQAVVKQLYSENKLLNSGWKIYNSSLRLIEDQFADYVLSTNKAECLQNAKAYFFKVTQWHLDNDELPPKTVKTQSE